MTDTAIWVDGLSKAYQIRHSQTRSTNRTVRQELVVLTRKPILRQGEWFELLEQDSQGIITVPVEGAR